jgi:succinoglycan biosynthesis protein ExoW
MLNNKTKICVIIPFYQEKTGILIKAIQSIYAQEIDENTTEIHIAIIDDESPISATSELDGLIPHEHFIINLIHQKNGGPGLARNTGLDYAKSIGAKYVAFLDSDDIWLSNHLGEGIKALEEGYGFYFCNHKRFNLETDWFSSLENDNEWMNDEFIASKKSGGGIVKYRGKEIFHSMIRNYLSQTSTVIYNFAENQSLRFEPELRKAGEDHFFWIKLSAKNKCILSTKTNVYCGEGINIYFSSFDWAKPEAIDRYGYFMIFHHKIIISGILDDSILAEEKKRFERTTTAYSYLFIRGLFKHRKFNSDLLKKILKYRPFTLINMPFYFIKVILGGNKVISTW